MALYQGTIYLPNGTTTNYGGGAPLTAAIAAQYGGSLTPYTAGSTSTSAVPASTQSTTPSTVNTGRIPVTLGNGQTVYVDTQGNYYDASGNRVSNSTVSTSTAPATTSTASTSSSTGTSAYKGLSPLEAAAMADTGVTAAAWNAATPDRQTYWKGSSVFTSSLADEQRTNSGLSNTATSTGISYDPSWATYGITQDQWNQMSPTQQGVVGAALGAAKGLYSANASSVTLQDALAAAAKDPTIIAKYADALKIDQQQFTQTLQQLQNATSTQSQQYQTQFENDRKNLAEQNAAAGRAYSGYRAQAQDQLGQQEQGIVSSSRSAVQKSLNDATSAFEAKYGTNATNPASASYLNPLDSSNISLSGLSTTGNQVPDILSGTLAGGITGSSNTSKQTDVNNLAGQYVTVGQTPTVTQPT